MLRNFNDCGRAHILVATAAEAAVAFASVDQTAIANPIAAHLSVGSAAVAEATVACTHLFALLLQLLPSQLPLFHITAEVRFGYHIPQ